ncbi:MAG: ATP-dependent Clp protease ATP-binding subunit, partial [Ktedonobacteraceae bacterium]|nr:ATP-dependent Clp protease ATP-binding subunit [Ktedonobacteraceae bacterium]
STRYIQGRYQPDKSLDLLDEAAACVAVRRSVAPDEVLKLREEVNCARREKEYAVATHNFPLAARLLRRERKLHQALWQEEQVWWMKRDSQCQRIGEQEIADVVTRRTGVPVAQVSREEKKLLLKLEEILERRVVGQRDAVRAVASAIRRSRAHLRAGRRPVGSFLFVGSTGVGKTEMAHALAEALFGDESALVKLDMTEFAEYHYAARLIGSPPGYVGYEQAGQLTEAVRRRPYCIVLFDEIEKAHPHVLDLLLQILEDGHLTDSHGTRVDFSNTLVILTSNIGTIHSSFLSGGTITFARRRDDERSKQQQRLREQILTSVKGTFRSELLNRLDDIVVFQVLSTEHLR